MDDPYAELRKFLAEWDARHASADNRNPPIDLLDLRDMEFEYDWLVEGMWPTGAHLHIFAAPKTGKSLLALWIAGSIAVGRDPFTWEPCKRQRISYIDNEMTLKDLRDRIVDFGFAFEELQGWLLYHPYPSLAPMDTETGGIETLAMLKQDESAGLIIDTLSRVVQGEENSNDTYRNFFNHTGQKLKAADISLIRLDHAGHDPKRSRGASAKADDVDLVYSLDRRETRDGKPGFRLTRTHTRVANCDERVELVLNDDPVSIKAVNGRSWSQPAVRKARELDSINAPANISMREAAKLLKEAGIGPGGTSTLMEALKLRQSQKELRDFGL